MNTNISKDLHKAISGLLSDLCFEAYIYGGEDPPICIKMDNILKGGPDWESDLAHVRARYHAEVFYTLPA